MTGPLSKLIRVSDSATVADAVFFWVAIAIILAVMLSAQVAFIAAFVVRAA